MNLPFSKACVLAVAIGVAAPHLPSAELPADKVEFAGLSPEAAAQNALCPPGFSVRLFAGEPDVAQPIAFCLDERGRVWVAEGHTYPRRAPEGQGVDRIIVFEDTNGDHRFDKRTVFAEKLNLVSALAVGFGGVWVGAAPYLLFIPDRNRDDIPDAAPEVVLDGWGYQDTHETLNTFTWGPDGWLYGCHGVFTHSKVGKPGAADSERVPLNAGVFRYHPTKKSFELFSEGTSNPWGVDFDAFGQCHIEACVIPHFYHMIQGARYIRQGGTHFNPHTYGEIDTIADHFHYSGSQGPHAANGRSDSAGGGHAHAGLMIYQGDSWPEQYRGKAFMNNIHGQRFNMDILERRGSGFVARHGQDFVNFRDKWSQILHIISDQDGSAYAIDWYDANQCHHGRTDGHDRSNGRIFKIVYNNQPVSRVDLSAATDEELVRLQLHPNDFNARHARRLLQERSPNPKVHQLLLGWLGLNGSKGGRLPKGWLPPDAETQQLRLLWTLHACEGLNPEIGMKLLRSPHEYVRAWAIQLMLEDKKVPDGLLDKMASMARSDRSPVVRLYIAAALQRVPPADRMNTLLALLSHAEDTTDHNLPFMYWYAAEPLVAQGADQGLKLLQQSKIPKVREYIARRMTAAGKSDRLSAF